MDRWPQARRFEFVHPLELIDPQPGEVLVDFPSGNGYLGPFLSERWDGVTLHSVEHVEGYRDDSPVRAGKWTSLPFPDGSVDALVTIATLHHVLEGRTSFYREVARILGPAGRLVIADVAADSPPSRFLDEFVGSMSSEGHTASFLKIDDEAARLAKAGFKVVHTRQRRFPWCFDSRASAVTFCRGLFRLDRATDAEIAAGLERYLGWRRTRQGIELAWELAFLRADRQASRDA